ncbi:MAG: hypothetical protein J6T16_08280 [Opitutales bacterium]|nr:hypothetical protein [Opitutales bacterium]
MGVVKKIFCSAVFVVFAACAQAQASSAEGLESVSAPLGNAQGEEGQGNPQNAAAQNRAQRQGGAAQAPAQMDGKAWTASDLEENIDYEKLSYEELVKLIKSLPQTETAPEILELEQKVLNTGFEIGHRIHHSCMVLIMYYLGWGKYDKILQEGHYLAYIPTNRQMREGKGEIRDAKKAYLYALLLMDKNVKANTLAYFYYEGIFVKKDLKKVEELFYEDIEPILKYPFEYPWQQFATFAYWLAKDSGYKPGDIIKGKTKTKFEDAMCIFFKKSARNIYAGFFAPQDKEFAMSYIQGFKKFPTLSDPIFACTNLVLYYSGEFDPSVKDSNMAKKYLDLYKEYNLKLHRKSGDKIPWRRFISVGVKNPDFDESKMEPFAANILKKYSNDVSKTSRYLFGWLYYEDAMAVLPRLKERAILPEDEFKKLEEECERTYKIHKFIRENYYFYFPAIGNSDSK